MSVQISGAQIQNSAIDQNKLASNSVQTAKIANDAITTAKILDSNITEAKLSSNAVTTAKISNSAVTSAKVDLTGTWNFGSATLQAATPSNASDVAIKSYVDGIVGGGVYWKEPARAASTGNINLSNPGTDSFDGITLVSGDRLLVKDQSTASQNGVYDFNGSSSALTRSDDANSADELNGLAIFIKEGSIAADQGFVQTAEISTLGSDSVTFVQFTGLGQITAGNGLSKSGNTLNVEVGNGINISGDAVVFRAGLGLDFAGDDVDVQVDDSSIGTNGSGQLEIKADGITSAMIGTNQVTGNEISAGGVGTANLSDASVTTAKLGASAVTEAKLASLSISEGKIQNSAITAAKIASAVAGDGLSYNSSTGLAVGVDNSTVEINTDALRIKDLGVTTAKIANSGITAGKLANDSVTKDKINADCAGNGLAQNVDGSLEVSVSDGLEIISDSVAIKNGQALDFAGGALDVQVDDASLEVDAVGNHLQIKNLGVDTQHLAAAAVSTAKIADDAVTAAKVGFQAYQELTTVSGSSTTSIDLAREVDSAFSNGILAYKNGLALLNQSALGGSAANSDEFTLSIVGGVTRLSFGSALADADSILIVYMT